MTDVLQLETVDADGALREALDKVGDGTRAGFLKKTMLTTGGIVGGGAILGALATPAQAATANDVSILNFALTLEYLEAAFYAEAVSMGALRSAAVAKPSFNFQGTTESQSKFKATAQVLEDTGVMAYAGQAPLIDSGAVLAAALSVHSVEARHASWIRHLNGANPAPAAFDPAKTKAEILAAVAGTKFISGKPAMTSSGGSPAFTG